MLTNGVVELDTDPLSGIAPTVLIHRANKSDISIGQMWTSTAGGCPAEECAAASWATTTKAHAHILAHARGRTSPVATLFSTHISAAVVL